MADKKAGVKSKVEAILFSVGQKISLDEISRLSRSNKEDALAALKELQAEYDQKQSSLMLIDEGDFWKFSVRDHLISVVRKIVTETELTKSVLETLAVIAFKYPILQSDLIKIRTNKAYDHLAELESSGYISRQKHGRTNLIKLTEKFFRYFDLTEEKLKDQFKDFGSIAKAIQEKEKEVEKIKEDQRKMAEELKKEDEKIRKEIKELDKAEEEFEVPVEVYEAKPKDEIAGQGSASSEKDMIGDLEVVDEKQIAEETEKKPEMKTDDKNETEEKNAETEIKKSKDNIEHKQAQKSVPRKKRKGIEVTPEMQKKVDEKVQQMVQGEKPEETQQ